MSPAEILDTDLADAAQELRARQVPFAFATIVRTAGATAAKPGAKALLSADGTIVHGWLGGGCTRGAVKRAAVEALQSGVPQLISVAPEDLLAEKGVAPGDTVDGTHFARNGCPSRGTVDIFIEPCLPMPELVILGTSPVAQALSTLAPQFHWSVSSAITSEPVDSQQKFIVIATQGQGDLDALKAALSVDAAYVAFVGSGRKYSALAEKLHSAGIGLEKTKAVNAPAGLDLGAVTPEEIALSILAQLLRACAAEKRHVQMGRVAAILLAAGLSRRMGARNKLLMSVAGEPMVRHLAQTYLSILTTPLTVVTGHDSDRRMMRLVKRLKALREKLKMTPEQANNIRFPCC